MVWLFRIYLGLVAVALFAIAFLLCFQPHNLTFKISDVVIAIATLLGPIAAVQVQKIVERSKSRADLQEQVFRLLMANRHPNAQWSREAASALNMIDLAFVDKRSKQSPKNAAVRSAWQAYLAHLSGNPPATSSDFVAEHDKRRVALYVDILLAMSQCLAYPFSKEQLTNASYLPSILGQIEDAKVRILKMSTEVLEGNRPVPIVARPMQAQPAPQGAPMNPEPPITGWQREVTALLAEIRDRLPAPSTPPKV